MEKVIIVGAGLSGSTIARLCAESGYEVIVMDRRENIGGNAYDYTDDNGITIQPYGPHIFHTDKKEVFDFLSRFTEWRKYEHKVLARVRKDRFVPVPFNITSLFALYPKDKAERIKSILLSESGLVERMPILKLKKHENKEIRDFADFVYKHIFYIYTVKQWGLRPEQLGGEAIDRVPVYLSEDDRYFADEYQFMPKNGFSDMVANILRHPHIKLKLKTDAIKEIRLADGQIYFGGKPFDGTLIYTGCLDELFDYKYGVLPYRSLKFKLKTKKCSSYQPSAVVNYTTSAKYTRITEFTKFTCEEKDNTVISIEYPTAFKKGKNIPYYPIPRAKNREHYLKYYQEAKAYKNLYLLGRLANYKYINMDEAVYNAMSLFRMITEENFSLADDKEL